MAVVFVVKNDAVVHREEIELASQRKAQLGALYRKYGTNRLFLRSFHSSGQKVKWERVEFVWNSSCTEIKHANMFFLPVKELPPVLQMMQLVGAA
jgi:actin-related protein